MQDLNKPVNKIKRGLEDSYKFSILKIKKEQKET
jgi:hypothetical protein